MSKLLKREVIKYDMTPFFDITEIAECAIELYVDQQNKKEIEEVLIEYRKKFRRIIYEICTNGHNDDLYGREDVSHKARNVTAMKFKGKNNIRIGCKEFFRNGKKIVMIIKIIKKTQGNEKRIKKIYETIGGYEYDFK